MTKKQIKLEIRELKREMKEAGIRKISFMNGGLSPEEYRCNAELFRLNLELEKAKD